MRLLCVAFVGAGMALVAAACTTGEDLFSSGGSGLHGSGGSTPTTTTSSSQGGGSSTSTSSTSSGSGAQGGAVTTSSTGGSGGGGGGPLEIPCTNATCTGTEICCVSYQGEQYDHCAAPGTCGSSAVEVDCDGPDHCSGTDLCCGRWVQDGGSGYYTDVACAPTCVWDGQTDGVIMCESEADCLGGTCVPSSWLPTGFSYCG